MDENGRSLALSLGDANQPSEPALIPDFDKRILQCLVDPEVSKDELPVLIATIVSNMKAGDIVECLEGSNAQIFIDVMDEVCHQAIPFLRNRLTDLF